MHKQIVEIAGEAVGTLMPHARGLRFVAVKFHVWPLDGEVYADPATARQAVTDHIAATHESMRDQIH